MRPNDAASFSISGRGEYGEGGGVFLTSELALRLSECRVSARFKASPFRGDGGRAWEPWLECEVRASVPAGYRKSSLEVLEL